MKRTVLLYWVMLITSVFIAWPVFAQVESEQPVFKISPVVIAPTINGDKEKFEEDHWLSRNVTGGFEEFSYSQRLNNTDKIEVEAKALAGNNDYNFNGEFIRAGIGNIILEFEKFSKYYDGSGGYSTAVPSALSSSFPRVSELDRDLRLDIGKFKIGGVWETENRPVINLSYEREHKDGAKSLTSWSTVESGAIDPKSYPLFLELDEKVDTFKAGIAGDIKGVKVSFDQTVEHMETETFKNNNLTVNAGGALTTFRRKWEDLDYDQYNSILRFSKQLNEKVFSSLGVMFTHYIGGSIETITDESTSSTNENHPPNPASLDYNVLTLLKTIAYTPSQGVALNVAFKAEFSDKDGTSVYNRDKTVPVDGIIDAYRNIENETDKNKIAESFGFKYGRIKNTVVFLQTEFEQEKIRQYERQTDNVDTSDVFSRLTETYQYNNDYTIGFKWYATSKINLTPQYKYKQRLRDYDHKEETGDALNGYSAFIDSMDILSHLPSLRLNYKPNKWLAYNLFYSYNTEVYKVRTAAADTTEQARYQSHVSSIDVTLSPRDYLFFDLLYQRTKAATRTGARKSSGTTFLPAYKADNDVVSFAGNYAPNNKMVLRAVYSMSKADNNDSASTILPLGLDNLSQDISLAVERKINKDTSLDLGYTFARYDEDSNAGADDYDAHIISASFKHAF